MQPRGNIISYFGEQIAFQVRLYKPYTNFILYAFWVPLNNNKIATAEKLLRENNHEYFVNQD
jgi:hypothetical protein